MARAGALAAALGVQHQVLSLEWDGSVGATYSRVRTRSCSTLLDFCKSSGLKTLMTAHHLDDQICECNMDMGHMTCTCLFHAHSHHAVQTECGQCH